MLGVIGGSGLYELPGIENVRSLRVEGEVVELNLRSGPVIEVIVPGTA